MSSDPHALSFGTGIVLRLAINTFCARNEKLAGALSGIWDGIVAYAAWRTDRLLEPLILVEIIAGVCFDALFHCTPTRLVSLGLGGALGVLLSDTAALHTLWDDVGKNVQRKLRTLDIKDDLDSPDVLTEFSEDVTVIEEYTVERRNPKMSTAEWIAAQRRARSSKSTSRRASASMNISTDVGKSFGLSGIDTLTQVTSRTQSTRARRDREILASMTPIPAPSDARSEIEIDVQAPSSLSRLSSPTIKLDVVPENESVRPSAHSGMSRVSGFPVSTAASSHTTRGKSPSAKSNIEYPPSHQAPSPPSSPVRSRTSEARYAQPAASVLSSGTNTKKSESHLPHNNDASTERGSFTPFIPPRPEESKPPSVYSAWYPETYLQQGTGTSHAAADVSTFLPTSPGDDLRSRMSRSRASTRRTQRNEGHVDPSVIRTRNHQSTTRSKSSLRPANSPEVRAQTTMDSPIQSEFAGFRHSKRPASPAPEVIIDYSGDTTRIYIPPPAETGVNVRIVPHAEDDQQKPSTGGPNVVPSSRAQSSKLGGEASVHGHTHEFTQQQTGSYPELDTVPSDIERNADDARQSRAGLSSDPQPPSVFNFKTAWRDSTPTVSSNTDGVRIVESDNPLPVFVDENLEVPAYFHVLRSRSNSRASSKPASVRRSHSASTMRSRPDLDSLGLHMGGKGHKASGGVEITKTPSVERLGPTRIHDRLRRPEGTPNPREGGPIPIARSQTHRRSSSFISSVTPDGSIFSRATKTDMLTRAQELQRRAKDVDAQCKRLKEQYLEAEQQDRHALAFALKCELETAEELASRLHRKVERALNSAHNETRRTDLIDVHGLEVFEALAMTKAALYAEQKRGGSKLSVIVGRGRESAEGLKTFIRDRMTKKHRFDVKSDDMNPNLIHIYFPPDS